MKSFILILSFALMTVGCGSQVYLDPTTLSSVVENKEFDFNATRAFPTNYDVINVLNSMPGSTSTRLLNLDPGYGFNLKKDLFSVALPYFGRAFNVNPGDTTKGGLTFESKEFTVKQSTSKKGITLFVITPRDQRENYVFNLEIFKNGSAFLSVQSNNRQPISFDGNISAAK
ncbi:MAG: hypothetical protein DI529_16100 [Chryseobacterium sp.]|nr:MAG: hypothetical protein DI529_16100 [Chryseobacterium sp.]